MGGPPDAAGLTGILRGHRPGCLLEGAGRGAAEWGVSARLCRVGLALGVRECQGAEGVGGSGGVSARFMILPMSLRGSAGSRWSTRGRLCGASRAAT